MMVCIFAFVCGSAAQPDHRSLLSNDAFSLAEESLIDDVTDHEDVSGTKNVAVKAPEKKICVDMSKLEGELVKVSSQVQTQALEVQYSEQYKTCFQEGNEERSQETLRQAIQARQATVLPL